MNKGTQYHSDEAVFFSRYFNRITFLHLNYVAYRLQELSLKVLNVRLARVLFLFNLLSYLKVNEIVTMYGRHLPGPNTDVTLSALAF